MTERTLFDKIYGCIAASNIGSAMGAAVEGWDHGKIEKQFGILQEFLPYSHYRDYNKDGSGRERLPGTTEDGIERQRLMCTAIIEKGDRIFPEDLAKIWIRDINPDFFGVQMEPCDEILYRLVKVGNPPLIVHGNTNFFPPTDAGRYQVDKGVVSFARSCHPIGIINAGDPEQAAQDALDLGKMYLPPDDIALYWGSAVTAAIAEAMKPDSSVESVINAAKKFVIDQVKKEIDDAINMSVPFKDVFEMRETFNAKFCNKSGLYAMSKAYEIVAKGFAVFYKTNGNPKESIIGAVNFGRDTDCLAAVAGGLAGALNGTLDLPENWIKTVDFATENNEYTVSKRTLKETSEGLFEALNKKFLNEKRRVQLFDNLESE